MDGVQGDLAAIVKEFRARSGFSQDRLGSAVGITARHIRGIEEGHSASAGVCRRLAAAMDAAGWARDLAREVRRISGVTQQDLKSVEWRLRQLEHRVATLERDRPPGAA